ncbi:sce7726 family protein [Pseudomonas parakoreensis]
MREAEIKRALTHYLDTSLGIHPGLFLEELQLSGGEVRADLVHIYDMHCYEIKSEADSLKRLIGQGSRYARVFDRITLVTAECHLKTRFPLLPPWWGIILVPEVPEAGFKHVRAARPNKRHEPEVLASLLKRDEALHLLTEMGKVRGWKSKSLYLIQAYIAELLTLPELKNNVRDYLLKRVEEATPQFSACPA